MSSDNPSGAGNQQERPGIEQWIVGFVDGEGCFSISVVRNEVCRLGWQVQHEFSATRAASSRPALELLIEKFGCGSIIEGPRNDNHRERTSTENREASRLRQVCLSPPSNGGRRASDGERTPVDCSGDRADEPPSAISLPGILRGHTPAGSAPTLSRRDGPSPMATWGLTRAKFLVG
jgi:hypothetical protein